MFCFVVVECCPQCAVHLFILTFSLFLLLQTEIAKRLNAILAQIMPFLSQEVSFNPSLGIILFTMSSYCSGNYEGG